MRTRLYVGERLFSYGFPNHPLTPKRYEYFLSYLEEAKDLKGRLEIIHVDGVCRDESIVGLFHTEDYISRVKELSEKGYGYIDYGDTPVFKGIYEVSIESVCVSAYGLEYAFENRCISVNLAGGWHHAFRDRGAGFCVFNDIGVAIEYLRSRFGRDLVFYYIDIDAHHGDGVYYSYEEDPKVYIFDVHEDGRFLFPGTGFSWEVGRGEARGTKINVPLHPWTGDEGLRSAVDRLVDSLRDVGPDIVIFQAGQDGLAGDPLTHLGYTDEGYLGAVARILEAVRGLKVGLLLLGGGGYQPDRVARNWVKVLRIAVDL